MMVSEGRHEAMESISSGGSSAIPMGILGGIIVLMTTMLRGNLQDRRTVGFSNYSVIQL